MTFPTLRPFLPSALAMALAGLSLAAAPAQAQFFFDYYAGPIRPAPPPYPPAPHGDVRLSPREIVQAVREQGYRPAGRPMLNRGVYALDANDRAGRPVRLIVEAYDGEILQALPAAMQPAGAPPMAGFADPGEPRVIPAPIAPRQPQKPRAQKPPAPPASKAMQAEPAAPVAPGPAVGAAPLDSGPVPVAPLDAPPAAPPAPGVPVTPLD